MQEQKEQIKKKRRVQGVMDDADEEEESLDTSSSSEEQVATPPKRRRPRNPRKRIVPSSESSEKDTLKALMRDAALKRSKVDEPESLAASEPDVIPKEKAKAVLKQFAQEVRVIDLEAQLEHALQRSRGAEIKNALQSNLKHL